MAQRDLNGGTYTSYDEPTFPTVEPHVCDNDGLKTFPLGLGLVGVCQEPICRRVWHKMANRNSWYDPTEGTDPSV
jgi:hypothetical protein